ncbi:polysaccharide biosynthesis/export family protein [Tellurirhabdus bombi]|uniref:polysaccharide biosynthesis/export family protein n=1 Tax=Tellurirhabdus bombi TaxID=2907205 RepID=UPI001F1F9386|nr:polysaccharide biosynthesis/export family protein [Tellurirhabdus bombi]
MNSLRWFLLSGLIACFASCVSSKKVAYFQDLSADSSAQSIALTSPYTPTIKAGDILTVQVSSLNPEATTFFNPYTTLSTQQSAATGTATPASPIGYLVSADGNIELPLLGKVVVNNLTTVQAADRIRDLLKKYLKEPTVNVRNSNFRISVIGEVSRPSMFTIPNEQITLLEALALAGDIPISGRRDNVLLIREEGGQRKFIRLDLTGRDLFKSPYYYMHPNDVLYVEPSKVRIASNERFYQITPIILSAASVLSIVLIRLL